MSAVRDSASWLKGMKDLSRYRGANEQEAGIDCPQGVVIRLRSLLIFSAGLAIFQGKSYWSAEPRAEANNTYPDFDQTRYHKIRN